jgi:methyl-accepting chemotaxis protein
MADNSKNGSSSNGIFLNKSILWKIVFVFILITLLSIIQFFVVFGSVTTLQNQTDDSFKSIDDQFDETFLETERIDNATNIQRRINNEIAELNTQLRTVQSLILGYLSGTNGNAEIQYGFTTSQIPSTTNSLRNLINSITHEAVDNNTGIAVFNQVTFETDNLLDTSVLIFDILPGFVGTEVRESFINFSNEVNFKIANLLEWMYSNNDSDLFETIKAEFNADSSFANNINDSLTQVENVNPQLFGQLSNMSFTINSLYVDLLPHIDAVIAEAELNNFIYNNYDFDEIKLHVDVVVDITDQINDVTQSVIALISGQETSLEDELFDFNSSFTLLSSLLNQLFQWSETSAANLSASLETVRENGERDISEVVDSSLNDIENLISTTGTVSVILLAISVLIISGLIILAYYQITKPIKHISYWSEKISDGDLSYNDYKSNRIDEIGVLHNNFRMMNKNLKDIIVEVKDSSTIISETADDLLSNTEEINATSEEVSAIAQSMAKGSTQQAELISTIVEELQITSEIVDDVISQINYNLRIIHELSEQTNILALNTAIEAANAGEFGRGFSVISESIRKMASQSKKTTEEVTKDSREVLLQLQSTFSNITGKIENVAAVSEETAASAEEVAASAQELTAVMETVSEKSAMLNDRSSQSAYLVSRFKIDRKRIERETEKDNGSEKENGNGNGEQPAKPVE